MHRYGVSESGIICKGNEKIDYSYLFRGLFLAVRIKKLMFGHTKKTYYAQTHHSLLFVFKLEFQIGFSKSFVDFCHKFLWLEVFYLRKGKLMQEHDSKPQNPIITNVLYKSKILESWGRRIGTMVDECKRVGLPAPEFNTDGNFVWVVFKYNRSSVVNTQQATQQVPNKLQNLFRS